MDLPEWATRSLGDADAATGVGDDAGEATDVDQEAAEPARGWRERNLGSWSVPEADEPPHDVAGTGEATLDSPPIAVGAEEAEAIDGHPDAADQPALPEPVEPPYATFGVPENPTLLLRPEPAAGAEPSPASFPERDVAHVPTRTPKTAKGSAAAPEVPSVIDLTPHAPRAEPRAFPLPEGEVVFRNLRTAFTDPSRLLRHLASDGHTGVLEIISGAERSSYVVLLEGGVVAVAHEADGVVRTTNRVGFPAFPDGHDTLNVFRYPPAVARGLGLLLHAPVHFSGLGAVFVDLDGLNTYLQGHRADGGLVVADGDRLGVALFAAGELVGAYTSDDRSLGDLERVRALVTKPDAEIDVRMGGPAEPSIIPLDELLRDLAT